MPSRNAILDMLYKGTTTIEQFNWDSMNTVPLLYLMTPDDIEYIRKLITSPRYSGNNRLKMQKIDEVMHTRGFSRFAGGTNRLVYTHPSAPNAVFKVAIDSVGINDNPAEFRNQQFLKPYCCKVFECSPCGTIASFEKVERITTFEEFYTIADDVFYLLSRVIIGKYVMEDIGIDYFMNYGIRRGHSPVILDFPYLFELDGAKLECSNQCDDGSICRGEIDYDHGFNKLVCKKCGREYRARDLAKPPENGGILLRSNGGKRMKIELKRGNDVVKSFDTSAEQEYLSKANYTKDPVKKKNNKVTVVLTGIGAVNKFNTKKKYNEKQIVKHVKAENKSIEAPETKKTETLMDELMKKVDETQVAENVEAANKCTEAPAAKKIETLDMDELMKQYRKTEKIFKKKEKAEASVVLTGKSDESIAQKVIDVSVGKVETPIVEKSDCNPEVKVNLVSAENQEEVKCEKATDTAEEILDNPEIVPITKEDEENNKTLINAVTFGDDDPDTEEDLKSAEEALGDGGLEEGETPESANGIVEEQPKEEVQEEEIKESSDNANADAKEEDACEVDDSEDGEYEEQDSFVITYELPDVDDAAEDTLYFVAKNKDTDITVYDDVRKANMVDSTLFDAYIMIVYENKEKEFVKVEYNKDNDEWVISAKNEEQTPEQISTPAVTSMGDDGVILDGDHFDEPDLVDRIGKSIYKDSLKDYAYGE